MDVDSEMVDLDETIMKTTELDDTLNLDTLQDVNELVEASMHQSQIPILGDAPVRAVARGGGSTSDTGLDDDESDTDEEPLSGHVEIITRSGTQRFPVSSTQTGVAYDVRMRFHEEYFAAIDGDQPHPENSSRILAIFKTLAEAKLVQHEIYNPIPEVGSNILFRIASRYALKHEICLVHEKPYYKRAKEWQKLDEHQLVELGSTRYESIYLHQTTFKVALLAAGCTIETCRQVVSGQLKNAIAVVRPPGHHAEPPTASGFCIFNNVAIAARVCQLQFPTICRKILILDWDVHHGNGIQKAFENDPNVLYISVHVHANGEFYPQNDYGDHTHCGEGPGLGFNVNIPWYAQGMGDGDYILAFEEIVMPIAREFDPDFVIVAAGFDAAEGDPLGGCHVSPPCYGLMTHQLKTLANGKLVVVLEGGYTLNSISKSALSVTKVLMSSEDLERLPDASPSASTLGRAAVDLVKRTQAKYWKCMYPKPIAPSGPISTQSDRLHDVIREWQGYKLLKDHGMTPLMILRQRISRTYDAQVLATPSYDQKKPLLVIFHDPPNPQPIMNPMNGRMDWHNTFMTDETKTYIDWATSQNIEVIDVNVPHYVTDIDDNTEYEDTGSKKREDQWRKDLQELSTYLWVNYIQCADNTHVFLLGIGDAHIGVVDLISTQEGCEADIDHVFAFICNNRMVPVNRPADDRIHAWYKSHSSVYIDHEHPIWEKAKIPKRFGKPYRSEKQTMNEILVERRGDVESMILAKTEDWRTEQEQLNKSKVTQLGPKSGLSRPGSIQQTGLPIKSDVGRNGSPFSAGTDPYDGNTRSPGRLPQVGFFPTSPRKKV